VLYFKLNECASSGIFLVKSVIDKIANAKIKNQICYLLFKREREVTIYEYYHQKI
jgi:hypothetical protein